MMCGLLRFSITTLTGFLMSSLIAMPAIAQTGEELFRGKTISVIIGAGEGGFYDLNARFIARFMRKHIPGSPILVPQNMPGASQLRATEHAYNIAPRDGSALLVVQPYVILNKLQNDSLKFEIQKLKFIGRIGPIEMGGMVGEASSIKNVDDARKREVIFGANAANGPAAMVPWAINRLAGTRFKVVLGYQSQTAEELAIERGEIEGFGNGSFGEMRQQSKLRVLYVSGLKRLPSAPDAPTILELVKPEDKAVMDLLASISEVGLSVIAPPEVSPERIAVLRQAFDQMMQDTEYLASLASIGFPADAMSGAQLEQFVRERFSPSPAIISRLRSATSAP
jgi:tripartite-type tricarboxylate transporter receptor subunit TctC